MDRTTSLLLAQLNGLLRLTATEATIADARTPLATSEKFERELRDNATRCSDRTRLISDAIRELGSAPDVVGSAVGRVGAAAKLAVEQGQSIEEALLGDMALAHQLLDRTRFCKMLAEQADVPASVTRVLDRLENGYSASVEWLMQRLAEVALSGPPAFRPSPMQVAVGASLRISQLPARTAAETLNRSIAAAGQLQQRAGAAVSTNIARTRQLVDAAGEIWTAGRDASLERSQAIADQRGNRGAANAVRHLRQDLGAMTESELPIRKFDGKTVVEAVAAIDRPREPEEVRMIVAYEVANKNRKGVVNAANARFEFLAEELVGAEA